MILYIFPLFSSLKDHILLLLAIFPESLGCLQNFYFLEDVWFHLFLNNSVHSCARLVRFLNVCVEGCKAECQSSVTLLCCLAEVSSCTHFNSTLISCLSRSCGWSFCHLCVPKPLKAPRCSVLSLQEVGTRELMFLWTLTPLAILTMHWGDSALPKAQAKKNTFICFMV